MVSICLLLWQRDVKLQQTEPTPWSDLFPIQCYNMGHNVQGINMHFVFMIFVDNLHVCAGDILTGGLSVLVYRKGSIGKQCTY